MGTTDEDTSEAEKLPSAAWVGQTLDWNAPAVQVALFCELPFWLMVPNTTLNIEVNGCVFPVEICNHFHEIFVSDYRDSRQTRIYIGPPDDEKIDPEVKKLSKKKTRDSLLENAKPFSRFTQNVTPLFLLRKRPTRHRAVFRSCTSVPFAMRT